MTTQTPVLEYKCPCCNAALVFSEMSQKLACDSCGNTFEVDSFYNSSVPDVETGNDPFSYHFATSIASSMETAPE